MRVLYLHWSITKKMDYLKSITGAKVKQQKQQSNSISCSIIQMGSEALHGRPFKSMAKFFFLRIFIWLPLSHFQIKLNKKKQEEWKAFGHLCEPKSNECKALKRRTNIFGSYAFQSDAMRYDAWLNSSHCYQLAIRSYDVKSISLRFSTFQYIHWNFVVKKHTL